MKLQMEFPDGYTTICLILYIIFLIMGFINKSIHLRNFAKENVYIGESCIH